VVTRGQPSLPGGFQYVVVDHQAWGPKVRRQRGVRTIATLCLTWYPPVSSTNRYRAHLAKMHAPCLRRVLSFFGWVVELAEQQRGPKSRL
jgi:hypothetical protein